MDGPAYSWRARQCSQHVEYSSLELEHYDAQDEKVHLRNATHLDPSPDDLPKRVQHLLDSLLKRLVGYSDSFQNRWLQEIHGCTRLFAWL